MIKDSAYDFSAFDIIPNKNIPSYNMAVNKRKFIDWDCIEPLYRAGSLSLNAICSQYEADHKNSQVYKKTLSHPAILKKAKDKGWTRNLADQVKTRINEKLVTRAVTACNQTEGGLKDTDIVEQVAEAGCQVVIRHRSEIKALADREDLLLTELDALAEEEKGKETVTLKDKTIILKNIAHVRSQRITLERQAYNLNDNSSQDKGETLEGFLLNL